MIVSRSAAVISGRHLVCRSLTIAVICILAAGRVGAEAFLLPPGDDVIGAIGQIRSVYEDTFVDVGRRHGLGYEEMIAANPGVDAWLPGADTELVLPTQFVLPDAPRRGLVVNLAEYRMYFYQPEQDGVRVYTFPISIGRMDWSTPLGRAAVVSKVRNPAWYPPDSVRREHEEDGRPPLPRVVPPGPANPLGAYAMRLSVPGYLIHGTNKPDGIGMRVTHGCIRMYPEDIQWLFPQVSVQTPVQLVHQPFKMGWSGDALLLEVHRPLDEADEAAGSELTLINRLYIQATAERDADMDWELVEQTYRQRTGLPVVVGKARARETVVAAQP